MELRPLGRTGMLVSPIGLGTVKIGRNTDVKYPEGFELPSDDDVVALLRTACDLCVNVIDTAPAYGTSEERLGALLDANDWFGGRDQWVVATKVGESHDAVQGSSYDFSPEHTRESVERSLRRLKTDRLDVVLVHSDGRDVEIVEQFGTLDALAALADEGKVRAFGLSTKTPAGAASAIDKLAGDPRAVMMLTLNPRDRDDLPAIDRCGELGIGVLVKKALLSGHVDRIGEYLPAADVDDPVGACLQFVLGFPVSSVIVGTRSPGHLRDAVERAP